MPEKLEKPQKIQVTNHLIDRTKLKVSVKTRELDNGQLTNGNALRATRLKQIRLVIARERDKIKQN